MGLWRNWYTRTLEVRIPKGVEVQVLSSPPNDSGNDLTFVINGARVILVLRKILNKLMLENFGMPASMSVHRSELGNSMPMHNDFGMPASMGVFRDSQRPILPYVDPGRAKFLEIQKMEWEYKPPSPYTSSHYKRDLDWLKLTPYEPIIPKPTYFFFDRNPSVAPIPFHNPIPIYKHEPIKLFEPEPIKYQPIKLFEPEPYKPYMPPVIENPYFKPLPMTDFGFQPIKIANDLFPKRGGMHDSFNVTRSGDIFNGHTTIELKGGLRTRLSW